MNIPKNPMSKKNKIMSKIKETLENGAKKNDKKIDLGKLASELADRRDGDLSENI